MRNLTSTLSFLGTTLTQTATYFMPIMQNNNTNETKSTEDEILENVYHWVLPILGLVIATGLEKRLLNLFNQKICRGRRFIEVVQSITHSSTSVLSLLVGGLLLVPTIYWVPEALNGEQALSILAGVFALNFTIQDVCLYIRANRSMQDSKQVPLLGNLNIQQGNSIAQELIEQKILPAKLKRIIAIKLPLLYLLGGGIYAGLIKHNPTDWYGKPLGISLAAPSFLNIVSNAITSSRLIKMHENPLHI